MQFSAVPYNLLKGHKKANYLTTGAWSSGAINEASKFCEVNNVCSSHQVFNQIPNPKDWSIEQDAAYFHYCDNETVHGVEFPQFPYELIPKDQILVCDMSSNIGTRPVDWNKYGMVYAGVQKNIGPAGSTVAIIREDLISKPMEKTPILCDWDIFNRAPQTFFNTPSCYSIYVCGLNLEHMIKQGGVEYYEKFAKEKSSKLYDYIDSTDYYRCIV